MELQKTNDTASRKSHETSLSTPTLPDKQTAALLSMLIDKSRAAMGWGRLPEKEQDIAIITWHEILFDAGVPVQRYAECYRSAQQRKNERVADGKELTIVTPNDVAVEWRKVKDMNAELDKTRLLPEHNLASCQRCFGTGKEEMPDGSVREGCKHLPFTDTELEERAQAKAQQIKFMRDAVTKIGSPKPVVRHEKPKRIILKCSVCGRRDWKDMGWEIGEQCKSLESGTACEGQMLVS